jgi:DNA-binding NarL/FixJ family response regulator
LAATARVRLEGGLLLMDAIRRAALLDRVDSHYARFEHDAQSVGVRGGFFAAAAAMQAVEPKRSRSLSGRELAVVGLLAEGYTDRQVADELFIGENTVKTYVRNILAKLDAKNRTQAVVTALRSGELTLERFEPLAQAA